MNISFTRTISKILLPSQKIYQRPLSLSSIKFCEAKEADAEEEVTEIDDKRKHLDRTKEIPVETSIKYLNSSAYKETYGEFLVWEQYR